MKIKHRDSLRARTIAATIVLTLFIFVLPSGVLLYRQGTVDRNSLVQSVSLTAEKKAFELNACFSIIEKLVRHMQDYILSTLEEERIPSDAAYEEAYMSSLTEKMISMAGFADNVVAMYFRMNAELYGGTTGIFLEGNPKKGFVSVKPTDLTLFSPTDIEHVGWYYIPVWAMSPVWTEPYENKNINIHMISYVIPVYRNGILLGVVGMDINLATLKDIVDTIPLSDALGLLIGKEENLIYYRNENLVRKSVEWAADTKTIVTTFQNTDGSPFKEFYWGGHTQYGVMKQLENGMALVVSVPRGSLVRNRYGQIVMLFAAFVVVCLVTAVFLYLALKEIIVPVRVITHATNKLSRGELNISIAYKSKNELGYLADNIRRMTQQMNEYIGYIKEQTQRERAEKEAALTESRSKSEYLASIYLSLHEIDLNEDTFSEIEVHSDIAKSIGSSFKNARATVRRVMEERVRDKGKEREDFMEFINFDTLEERMKNRKSISHEFEGSSSLWCRARFILVDRNADGALHHVLWAVEDISEEKAVRDRLQVERDYLLLESERNAAASQAKSAFLANMSHEIRTPINAVLGMDEMILRESDDRDILGYAANIKSAGSSLLSIVNDILDFSKIEAGKMELLPENYDISSVVVDLVNMIQERAKAKDLAFVLQADPAIPKTLFGDSVRIKQCILNLLTNAVKYTKEGSVTFSIGFHKTGDSTVMLEVSVKDTGSGIKQEDMKKLFAPFERIEEGKNKTIEGTGLGMSIVRNLLSMMGTRLNVESEYGKGSVFSFEVSQPVVDWTAVGDINEAYRKSVEQLAKYKEKLHAPRARLLFVDDTEMNLEVIKGLLKKTEITIDTALSGKEAIEKVQHTVYDILFIDHRMPEMDGIETLHAMQQMDGNLSRGKPCVALTANALTGVRKMYLDEGFTDYLSKPVNPAKLEQMIKTYLPPDYLEKAPDDEDGTVAGQPEEAPDAESPFVTKLRAVDGIDVPTALANCGTEEILVNAVKKYAATIEEKASELQVLFESGDIRNYGTKVHALKSTSRLIGASEVSSQAAYLESCADKGDRAEIQAHHKPLLDLFLSFRQKLAPVVADDGGEAKEKKKISDEELAQKLRTLADCADSFDLDGLDALIAELADYELSTDFVQAFAKIRTCVENVDFKELRNLLAQWI